MRVLLTNALLRFKLGTYFNFTQKVRFMFKTLSATVIGMLLLTGQSAQANIEVNFIEGAPKDRFIIKNASNCNLKNLTVEIDLSQSVGKLIFDTTASGAGVEVFQPFEVTKGSISLVSQNRVKDGAAKLALDIKALNAGDSASFTIDVDDTLPIGELGNIRVANSEIQNGMVKVSFNKQKTVSGVFGNDSNATILQSICSPS